MFHITGYLYFETTFCELGKADEADRVRIRLLFLFADNDLVPRGVIVVRSGLVSAGPKSKLTRKARVILPPFFYKSL